MENDDFKKEITRKVNKELEKNHNFGFAENIREEKCAKCKGSGEKLNDKKKVTC
jgi:hypothetical protein